MLGGIGTDCAGGDPPRPAHQQGHANAAFEERALETAVWFVVPRNAGVPGPAVVTGEDHQRIFVQPGFPQFGQNIADPSIHLANHRPIDAFLVVLDLR